MMTVQYAVQNSLATPPPFEWPTSWVLFSFDFLRSGLEYRLLWTAMRDENGGIHTDKTLFLNGFGRNGQQYYTIEMTAAFATFGNGGVYYKPTTYTVV